MAKINLNTCILIPDCNTTKCGKIQRGEYLCKAIYHTMWALYSCTMWLQSSMLEWYCYCHLLQGTEALLKETLVPGFIMLTVVWEDKACWDAAPFWLQFCLPATMLAWIRERKCMKERGGHKSTPTLINQHKDSTHKVSKHGRKQPGMLRYRSS